MSENKLWHVFFASVSQSYYSRGIEKAADFFKQETGLSEALFSKMLEKALEENFARKVNGEVYLTPKALEKILDYLKPLENYKDSKPWRKRLLIEDIDSLWSILKKHKIVLPEPTAIGLSDWCVEEVWEYRLPVVAPRHEVFTQHLPWKLPHFFCLTYYLTKIRSHEAYWAIKNHAFDFVWYGYSLASFTEALTRIKERYGDLWEEKNRREDFRIVARLEDKVLVVEGTIHIQNLVEGYDFFESTVAYLFLPGYPLPPFTTAKYLGCEFKYAYPVEKYFTELDHIVNVTGVAYNIENREYIRDPEGNIVGVHTPEYGNLPIALGLSFKTLTYPPEKGAKYWLSHITAHEYGLLTLQGKWKPRQNII